MLSASLDEMEGSLTELAWAAESLAELSQDLQASPDKSVLHEVRLLRVELAHLASMIGRGLEFCRRWSNTLQSAAGYLPSGEGALVGSSTTISVQG
jgi:hypothetical protein